MKSLYSCHLAWIDDVVWHRLLTRGCGSKLIGTKSSLEVVSTVVTLFLPFSLDRRRRLALSVDARLRFEVDRDQVVVGSVNGRHSIPAI